MYNYDKTNCITNLSNSILRRFNVPLHHSSIKKIDELEGPENIHFSLVELIQKGRKKMEEIVDKLNNNNK